MHLQHRQPRGELIENLTEMRGELSPEEADLRELTDSALSKLQAMSDNEFDFVELPSCLESI